jgi:ribosome biogenesis ATPase
MWMAHRKTKLNLNGPAPISSPTPASGVDENSTTAPTTPPPQPFEDELPSAVTIPVTTPGASESRTGKRKVRTRTATGDGEVVSTGKRPKLGAIAKDYAPPSARLADLGGVTDAVEKMLELVAMPLCHPEIYVHTGVHPPRGVLLHGPPGCGKTLLANAIAGVRFVSSTSLNFLSTNANYTGTGRPFHQHFCSIHCIGHVRRIGEDPPRYL